MAFDRSAGILLHVTSLPSYGGIGDFGPAAYGFIDFLAYAKQRLWQVLPLSPTGYGNSPYGALSAFAGNPLLISLEVLVDDGWLLPESINGLAGHEGPVNFESVSAAKLPLLEQAAVNFLANADQSTLDRFNQYANDNSYWLDDYAAYVVLRRQYGLASWETWPPEFAARETTAMQAFLDSQIPNETTPFTFNPITVEQVIQFFFDEQWQALRAYSSDRGIAIIGDVAIFVNYDSADVWTNPGIFDLDQNFAPIHISGVPPDYFSPTGQRWGNPVYRWDILADNNFDWWVARIRRSLALYDIIRLDHFRGFEAYWSIPAADETAENGEWVTAPGAQLFARLEQEFGTLPFIAEDLGVITPEVDALREQFSMPGMRILQFGFGDRASHNYLPHRYVNNTVVYTGTHDNNTTLGWWNEGASEAEKNAALTYLRPSDDGIVWALIRAAASSVADISLVPLQDVLHLGSEARMNTPSSAAGNWSWRYGMNALNSDLARKLAAIMEVTDRDFVPPEELPAPDESEVPPTPTPERPAE